MLDIIIILFTSMIIAVKLEFILNFYQGDIYMKIIVKIFIYLCLYIDEQNFVRLI